MSFVLDASIALSWCFADEASTHTWGVLERLAEETAYVPSLWALEMSNILILAERRKRISYAHVIRRDKERTKFGVEEPAIGVR